MSMTLAALKTEITTDPTGIGYAAAWASKTDWQVADALNLVRQTIDVDRILVPAYEIINAVVPAEWTALSAAEKQRLQTITGAGTVDASNANIRASFLAMFGVGTATRTALAALQKQKGSRAEALWGIGTRIEAEHVSRARES